MKSSNDWTLLASTQEQWCRTSKEPWIRMSRSVQVLSRPREALIAQQLKPRDQSGINYSSWDKSRPETWDQTSQTSANVALRRSLKRIPNLDHHQVSIKVSQASKRSRRSRRRVVRICKLIRACLSQKKSLMNMTTRCRTWRYHLLWRKSLLPATW